MAVKEAMQTGKRPPNLRPGNARERCQLCRHFDGKGGCRLYNYPVRPNQVSDSFSAATERDSKAGLRDAMQAQMSRFNQGGAGNGE